MKLTVPTIYQVCNQIGFGLDKKPNVPLDIFLNTNGQSECSDLAKLLGLSSFFENNNTMNDPYWWIYSPDDKQPCFPNFYKNNMSISTSKTIPHEQKIGIKPFLTPTETNHLLPNAVHFEKTKNNCPIQVYTFGQYPQSVADKETSKVLNEKLKQDTLELTGNVYFFGENMTYPFVDFLHISYPEYFFQNNRYICVTSQQSSCNQFDTLSNGSQFEKDKKYWIKVEPLEWYVDTTGHWITKNIILASIPFHVDKKFDVLEDTVIYQHLNTHFKTELERTLKNQTLLNYKLFLLSELQNKPIPNNRISYMQMLSHTAVQFFKTKIPSDETHEIQILKNDISAYTKMLISDFQKNELITSNDDIQRLKKEIYNEKVSYFNRLPNKRKTPKDRIFLHHFMSGNCYEKE